MMRKLLPYLLVAVTAAANPLVSVILPTYERPLLLRHALSQICGQPDVEIVVVDDSEHPDNLDELKALISNDQTLIYQHLVTRQSIGAKRNLAVELASGDYLIQVDDDDLYSTDRIAYQMEPVLEGKADATVLTHGTWIELRDDDSIRYWRVIEEDAPHYGTLAFTRDLWERLGGYADSSLAEDRDFWMRAHNAGRVVSLPNNGHHAYVRHGHATNPKSPSFDITGFEEIEESNWVGAAQELLQVVLPQTQQSLAERQLQSSEGTDCNCCVNANICVEYEQAWDMYDCPLHGPCEDVALFENTYGSCDTCGSGISCNEAYGSYDGCPQQSCGCCSNPNVCVEYEKAWDMYSCGLFGECPDVEVWEDSLGDCDTCQSGISCKDKYGSYDGCPAEDDNSTCLQYREVQINFDRYVHGKVVKLIGHGVNVYAQRKTNDGDFVRAKAMVARTKHGRGNARKIIIVSQDGNQEKPKANDLGGKLVFRLDQPIYVRSLGVLDAKDGALFRVWTVGSEHDLKIRKKFPTGGQHRVKIDVENVRKLEVQFYGGGAVTDLQLAVCIKREG